MRAQRCQGGKEETGNFWEIHDLATEHEGKETLIEIEKLRTYSIPCPAGTEGDAGGSEAGRANPSAAA